MREKYCIIFFYIEGPKLFEISTDYITLLRIRNLPDVVLGLVTEYRETMRQFVSLTM